MRGDLICIPENIELEGYNFIDLLDAEEEDFPLYGIARSDDLNSGSIIVLLRGEFHGWSMPRNGSEYVEIIERFR